MRIQNIASLLILSGGLYFGPTIHAAYGQSIDTSSAQTIDAGFATADEGPAAAPKKPVSFDLSAIDKTADPCTNFYQYACGNWIKNNPIPSDQVRWGRFNELTERNNYLLYEDLKAAAEAPKTALQTKYGDYFAACMNVDEVDKLGGKPIAPMLA